MPPAPSVFFFFVDGIGIGPEGHHNPFASNNLPGFEHLVDGMRLTAEEFHDAKDAAEEATWLVRSIDANLGVDGLPQSGTGQATLFTGVNCAQRAGRHWGPFPHSTSRPVLAKQNLFQRVGPERSAFANAYPERFFQWARKRDRWSTTTRCCLDSGVRIRDLNDLRQGNAIAADLTGKGLAGVAESNVPTMSEAETADRIRHLCQQHDLVVSEYFHTDKAGHAQDEEAARKCLTSIDRFLSAISASLDFSRTTFVLTSDHGNLEDLSIRTHTRHRVPLIVRGPGSQHFTNVYDLTGVASAIVKTLGRGSGA